MTNQYTPTTEEVRERYAAIFGTDAAQGEARAQFARWLSEHDAELLSAHRPEPVPAADEREALYDLWSRHGSSWESDSSEGRELADAIVAAGFRRPEPVTPETETEWEYGVQFGTTTHTIIPVAGLEEAEESTLYYPDGRRAMKRTPATPPGPWLPVEDGGEN